MKRLPPSLDLAMERSREVKRGASAPRRLRISCPKDPADAEARMDETPLIEKVKKGNLQAFSVSLSANSSVWSKRKRNGLQEAQILLERINGAKDSAEWSEKAPSTNYAKGFAEELEMTLSKEDEDEIPLLPNFRPSGKSTVKERTREDELVMDISNVPRRARSSSSRFSSLRRQQEFCSAGVSAQQVPTSSRQRSPSSKLLAKRPVVPKSRPLKDFRMIGSTHISDQEVEVAEVLFGLSKDMSSFAQSTSLTCQAKSFKGLEEEDLDSSSSQVAGNTASESLQKSGRPSDEPKRKRQRASLKEEENIRTTSPETVGGCLVGPFGVMHSSVMEANQLDSVQNKHCVANESFCQQPKLMITEAVRNPCYGDSQLHVVDDKNVRNKELARDKTLENNSNNNDSESIFSQEGLAPPSPSVHKSEMCGQVSGKDGEHSMLLSRGNEDQDANSSKVDPTCLPMKVSTEEEGEDGMQADNKRLSLSESSSISKGHSVKGASAADSKDERSSGMRLATKWNQELSKDTSSPWKEEPNHLIPKEKDTMILDLRKDEEAGSVSSSPLTINISSNNPITCIDGFPRPSFYGKAAPSWPRTSLDRTSYPAIQLPHTKAQHSVPRMRRCATHVHVAHYIQQQQRLLQQAYWPPACRSGAPYNPSTLLANLQGKEQWGKDTNITSLQAGSAHGHTPSQSIGTRMLSSRGSAANLKSENGMSGSSNSACVLSVGAQTGTIFGSGMTAAHAQYTQTTMQQNGFASLCMPPNGSYGQNASIFNRSLYPAHLSPQGLQSIAQQTSSLLHLPKRQGLHSSPHVGLSHPLSTQPHPHPHPQLQQQAQEQQLQHQPHYVTTSSQHYGAGSDGLLEGDRGCTMLRQKQSIVSHQQTQFQVQQAASSVRSPQLSSHNSGPRIRPKVRELDPSVSKGIDRLGISCEGRGSVGPVQLDLATSAKGCSGFSGACEIDRVHDQWQQILGAQKQQYYQQSLVRAPATSNAKRYPNKDYGIVEKKQSPIKQAESPADVGSKAMECHLPMNVVSSSCGGSVSIDLAMRKNLEPSSSSAAVAGETLLSPSWQPPHPQNQVQTQAMAHAKFVSGANTATGASVPKGNENVSVRGTLGKAPPSPGKTALSSQGILQSKAGTVKASHRSGFLIGSSLGQQAWGNLQNATNWTSHNSSASRPSSGTVSLCAFPTSSSLKVDGSSASNDTCGGQEIGPTMQGGVAPELPTVCDPNLTSVLNSREEVSTRVLVQPRGQGQGAQTQFSRQQSISSQLGAMHQMYHHPHLPSDKHQQYVHESPSPQPSWPLQAQQPSSQHIQPQIESSATQQSHLHRQLHSLPSNATLNGGISSSVTLRTALQGNPNNSTSPGGGNSEK